MCVFSKNKFQIVRLHLNTRKSCNQLDKKHPKVYIWASINIYSCVCIHNCLNIRSLKFYILYKAEGEGENERVQKWQTFLYIFILLHLLTCIWVIIIGMTNKLLWIMFNFIFNKNIKNLWMKLHVGEAIEFRKCTIGLIILNSIYH